MAFADCIISARDQGVLSREEGDELIRRYEQFRRARRGDPRGADQAAREDLAAALAEDAARRRQLAELQEVASERIAGNLAAFRTPDGRPDVLEAALSHLSNEQNRLAGYASVQGRTTALNAYAHGKLEELLHAHRRTFLSGRRVNQARLGAIVDEAFGQPSGDQAARGFWQAYRQVNDEFVGLFNAAGGQMPHIENFLPQKHEPRALIRAGLDAWRSFIRPRLDLERMQDPLTGEAFTTERLDEVLAIAWQRIVTDGWSDREATMQAFGKGALANQRGEHRFLQFRDAAGWREYQTAFGSPDIFATLMSHLNGLSKDIAALQVLGPNPAGTVEWLKQVVRAESAKAAIGEESLFRARGVDAAFNRQNAGQSALDNLWSEVRGGPQPENYFAASTMQALRNTLTGLLLPSAMLTAVSDPAIAAKARFFAGLPVAGHLTGMVRQLATANKREVLRAGVLVEDAMHHLGQSARYSSLLAGPEWSRWLPDRVLTWSGLTPWTNLGRRAGAFDFMAAAADRQGRAFDELEEPFRRYLAGFGIDEADWQLIQRVPAHEPAPGAAGLLRPVDIADARDPRALEVALRYSEAMHAFLEEATPQGSARTRAAIRGDAKPGTLAGEARLSMGMFLSFPVSFLATTLRGIAVEGGALSGRGAAYAGMTLIGTTLLGGVALQLAQLRDGKDPKTIKDPKFWVEALLKGGGLGIWGDYLIADVGRVTKNPFERLLGPVAALGADTLRVAGFKPLLEADEKYSRSAEALKFLQRYTPLVNLWYTRAAWNRVVIDQLQFLSDPNAHKKMRDRQSRLQREQGQAMFWRPGELAPDRGPDLGAMVR
jgi:hypothetical protein